MCGVAAVIGTRRPLEAVSRLLAAMAHRGPDGSGVRVIPGGALGVCRLRVRPPRLLTLPPVFGGVPVAYNGEIYGTLPPAGATPAGVPGELALLLGGTFDKVDGMWALARPNSHGLTLARDRWGLRPLYYRRIDDGWAVASEIPALIAVFGGPRTSADALAELLAFGAPLTADTVFEGIHSVPPGTVVELSAARAVVRPWPEAPCFPGHPGHAQLADALAVSVARNTVAERPVGLALSGGLDSALLGGALAQARQRDLVTVSVIVEDGGGDGVDRPPDPGPSSLGWEHVTTSVDRHRYLGLLERAVARMGYPTRMSSVPLYLALADAAADAGVIVLLTGEGADELFLGYTSYLRYAEHPELPLVDRLERLHFPAARRAQLSRLTGERQVRRCREAYRDAARRAICGGGPLRRLERTLSLRPLLERADLCLMSRGLEGRSPFLHGAVPALAAAYGEAELLAGGLGKLPLRELARVVAGPAAGLTPKRPFRAPVQAWLRRDKRWAAQVRSRCRRASHKLDLGRQAAVDSLVADAHADLEAAGLVTALLAVDACDQAG